ncbi:MAG: YciI family protein [Nocardioides sp.]
MRYLCFVKMEEAEADPPAALMEAMGGHAGQGFASGKLVDAGGLYGVADAIEYRVSGGRLSVTDGPYAEAEEVIGGWAIIKVDSEDEARTEGQQMADLHLEHWPTWEGAIELRRISEPDEAPAGS